MRAMILAAGRGERLRPLTDTIPKPLLKIDGNPLIARHLERLASSGFRDVVINLGWLGEQIPHALGDGSAFGLSIQYSQEPPGALETAGGIVHALPLLGPEPFAVISGDVSCDFPYDQLQYRPLAGLAHLVMVDNPPHHPDGDFRLKNGLLHATGQRKLTFSGIAIFHPDLFNALPPGKRPLRPVLEQAIAKNQVTGEHYRGQWLDIGTPERLAAAQSASG